jgi:hypothetical protein
MGRYYKHPVAPIIDYSYKLPFQELFQAMQMREKTQAQSLKTLRDSEAQMNKMFKATPGAKPDEEVRKQKMNDFNTFVSEMSKQDLTKGESINDINNYITDFARDEDVQAISQRNSQYEASMQELKDFKKKNGMLTKDQRYFFDQSISDYNKGNEYDRDTQWSGVSGYYDYGKELREIGKVVEDQVITRPGEDGRFYYTIKNTTRDLKKVRDAIEGGMSSMSRSALANEFSVIQDQYRRAGEEMPEGNNTFEEFVINKSHNASLPFIKNDSEMTGRTESSAYKERMKGAGELTTGVSAVQSFSSTDVSSARNSRRENDLSLRKVTKLLKDRDGLDFADPNTNIEQWLENNKDNVGALESFQIYEDLQNKIGQSDQFLTQVNDGYANSNKGKDFWNTQYSNFSERFLTKTNNGDLLEWTDDDGNAHKERITNSKEFQDLIVSGRLNISPRSEFRQILGDVFGAVPTGGGGSGKTGPGYRQAKLQDIVDNTYSNLSDFADEEEGLSSNVSIVRPIDKSKAGQARINIQELAQSDAALFESLEGGEPLGNFLTTNKIKRGNIEVNLTDGANSDGKPIVWVSGFDDDGEKIVSKGFAFLDETGRTSQIISESIIAAGQLNGNEAQVKLGERVAATPELNRLRATGLLQSPNVVAAVKASKTQSIVNEVNGYNGLFSLRVSAPNETLYYELLDPDGEPVQLTTLGPNNEVLPDDDPENATLKGYNLSTIAWMLYKERLQKTQGTAYDKYSENFIRIQ